MPESFSLARQAWIPVTLEDGQRVFVRPCDISQPFNGQAIIRIATGRPDCDISLTEFLIGLLAVATGPKDRREWVARFRSPPTTTELEAAFAPFAEALVLDGDGPRLFQDLEKFESATSDKQWKRPDQLFVDGPGDNTIEENADHFVKRGNVECLSRSGAAIALITIQTMSPSGGPGKLTSVRGGGPLTTIVIPGYPTGEATLWQRLWANIPEGFSPPVDKVPLVFPWLLPTRQGAKGGIKTTPEQVHPAQAFFGMPRRLRLEVVENKDRRKCDLLGIRDEWVVLRFTDRPKGTDYTAWSRGHPLSPYYKMRESDAEFLPLHLQSSRIGYRQWLGMVMEAQKGLRVPAQCLSDFPARARDLGRADDAVHRRARLLVAGYAMDNMKPLDFAESLLPLIITGSAETDEAIKTLAHNWVSAADTVASQTVSAINRALYGEKNGADRDSTVLEAIKARFWADTEDAFYAQLRAAADTLEPEADFEKRTDLTRNSSVGWLAALRRHALAIFDDTVPIEDAASDRIEDIIAGRKMLGLMLSGYGKGGTALYALLDQPSPEAKPKKGRKAA